MASGIPQPQQQPGLMATASQQQLAMAGRMGGGPVMQPGPMPGAGQLSMDDMNAAAAAGRGGMVSDKLHREVFVF